MAEYDLEEVKRLWQLEPDDIVKKAAIEDIIEYPAEIQVIILEEAKKRGLINEHEAVVSVTTGNQFETTPDTDGRGGAILSCIFVGVVLNALLWGFYEAYDYYTFGGDKQITKQKNIVDALEPKIRLLERNLKKQEQEIGNLASQLENLSNDSKEREVLLEKVVFAQLKYEADFDIYKTEYEDYVYQIKLYNELVDKQISRWYLIPIPIRTGGR